MVYRYPESKRNHRNDADHLRSKNTESVKGVINLRGKVIPIIDLRAKFSMVEADYTERTCIIVVEIDSESTTTLVGIVVDSVSEVMNISKEQIERAPAFGTQVDTNYILGMVKTEGGVKILLNIDRVLSGSEIDSFSKVSG